MTEENDKCPNCGCEQKKSMVFLTVCWNCDLPIKLWPKWREQSDELDRLQNLLKFANLQRGYIQEERDQLRNLLNQADLKNHQLLDELNLCSSRCLHIQKGGGE